MRITTGGGPGAGGLTSRPVRQRCDGDDEHYLSRTGCNRSQTLTSLLVVAELRLRRDRDGRYLALGLPGFGHLGQLGNGGQLPTAPLQVSGGISWKSVTTGTLHVQRRIDECRNRRADVRYQRQWRGLVLGDKLVGQLGTGTHAG